MLVLITGNSASQTSACVRVNRRARFLDVATRCSEKETSDFHFQILLVDAGASSSFLDHSWSSRDVRHSVSGEKNPNRRSLKFRNYP